MLTLLTTGQSSIHSCNSSIHLSNSWVDFVWWTDAKLCNALSAHLNLLKSLLCLVSPKSNSPLMVIHSYPLSTCGLNSPPPMVFLKRSKQHSQHKVEGTSFTCKAPPKPSVRKWNREHQRVEESMAIATCERCKSRKVRGNVPIQNKDQRTSTKCLSRKGLRSVFNQNFVHKPAGALANHVQGLAVATRKFVEVGFNDLPSLQQFGAEWFWQIFSSSNFSSVKESRKRWYNAFWTPWDDCSHPFRRQGCQLRFKIPAMADQNPLCVAWFRNLHVRFGCARSFQHESRHCFCQPQSSTLCYLYKTFLRKTLPEYTRMNVQVDVIMYSLVWLCAERSKYWCRSVHNSTIHLPKCDLSALENATFEHVHRRLRMIKATTHISFKQQRCHNSFIQRLDYVIHHTNLQLPSAHRNVRQRLWKHPDL